MVIPERAHEEICLGPRPGFVHVIVKAGEIKCRAIADVPARQAIGDKTTSQIRRSIVVRKWHRPISNSREE